MPSIRSFVRSVTLPSAIVATLVLGACSGSAPAASPTAQAPAKPTTAAAPAGSPAVAASPGASPAAGAQPAGGASTTAAAPKPAAEDLNALYEEAKKEGSFNFYATLNTQNGQPVIEKFQKKYPGVKVNYNRQTSEKLEEVMTQEAKAGKMSWDVVEVNEDVLLRLIDAGYIGTYVPSAAAAFPDNLRDPKGMWVSDRVNAQTPSINTSLTKPDETPKTWDDMTKPAWKGRVAVEEGNVLLFTAQKEEWGKDKALAFWKAIAANEPQIRSGNTMTAQLLAAGEFAAAVNIYSGETERLRQQGAPTKVVAVDPVFLQLQLVSIGAKAASPNAAKLFINWLLGDEGQASYNEVGILPARPDMFKKGAEYLGDARIVPIKPEVAAKAGDDLTEFRSLLGLR
jgi:iron(III) transport system substrate-binding protein